MGCALELPSQQQLDEKVVVKPRRIVATNGTSAVGIDLDVGGTLAFTVTDPEGSSLFELSRPDSEAVKDWFRMLQEASGEKKEDAADKDMPSDDELEERVRVLERIVTDRGYDVATQIEALRDARKVEALLDAREPEVRP